MKKIYKKLGKAFLQTLALYSVLTYELVISSIIYITFILLVGLHNYLVGSVVNIPIFIQIIIFFSIIGVRFSKKHYLLMGYVRK